MMQIFAAKPELFKQRDQPSAVPLATKILRDDLRQVKAEHMQKNLTRILEKQKRNKDGHSMLSSLDKYETNMYALASKKVSNNGRFAKSPREERPNKDYKSMMSDHEHRRKNSNSKNMNAIEKLDNSITGIENDEANEISYGTGQLMRKD